MKILPLLGATVLSWLGWYLAEPLGFIWAFLLSGGGALVGVYLGWLLARRYLR